MVYCPMKLSVLQEDLLKSVALASKFTSSKAQLPILGNILLRAKEGKLQLAATNLETGISTKLPAKIEKEGEITVPAKIILELISHFRPGQVLLEEEKGQLKVSSQNAKASVSGLSTKEFPNVPNSLNKKSFSLKKETISVLSKEVCFAAASMDTRPVLSGVYIKIGNNPVAVATDGFRLSYKDLKSENSVVLKDKERTSFLLPATIIQELGKSLNPQSEDINVELNDKEGQIIFESEEAVLTARLIEGQFPDYQKVLPKGRSEKTEISKAELLQGDKAASVFAKEAGSVIKLSFKKDGLSISSESNLYGSEEISIDSRVEGEELTIAFNYKFVLDFLNSITGDSVLIQTQSATSPTLFQNTKDDSYKHIIMPVRLQS